MGKVETPFCLNKTKISCSYLEVEERCAAYLLLHNKPSKNHKNYMESEIQVGLG